MVEIGAARHAPRQVLGDERRLEALDQSRQPLEMRGVEPVRAAERREWLCVNGIGGFASGTIAGTQTRRYHGLLIAALAPPLGRTLLAAQVHDTLAYAGRDWALGCARWASGVADPAGYRLIEH